MTIEEKIKGRKIGVIGMARSGVAAALLARRFSGVPFVTDSSPREKLFDQIGRLNEKGIPFETDSHTDQILSSDYCVISPGVPLTAELVGRIKERGIPIFSELEFASWICKGRIIAVTGSNGKTTTTTLLGEILKAAGLETVVCGNIGQPFSDVADQISTEGYAVVEVSTFQLETIDEFRPDIALILNLQPDHLDRHGSFEIYKGLKYRIAENQTADDCLILNADDPETAAAAIKTKATRIRFSVESSPDQAVFVANGHLCAVVDGVTKRVIAVNEIGIPGQHNLSNAAAACAAAVRIGVPVTTCAKVLTQFAGVEHRLELVDKIAGIKFVNDSKATNVNSTQVALQAMTAGVHLIMGGRGKGASYAPLADAGKNKIKSLVLIGESRETIFAELGKFFPVQFADSLAEAVQICFEAARPGETVLLSPACASFDMFDNYEHRGQVFKEVVHRLKKGKTANGTLTNH